MGENERPGSTLPRLGLWVIALAGAKLLLHVSSLLGYGYFGDELYYLACADHLAWGYVDQPPLSIAVLAAWKALFGSSLVALRLLPALTGAAFVVAVADLARRLGGGRAAQAIAATAALVAPVNLVVHGYFSMNAFDTLVWAAAADLFLVAVRERKPLAWPALGALLGLGLINKYSVLWLGAGLSLSLLLFHRDALRSAWLWAGAALALAIAAPHLLWQAQNGWPSIEFIRAATGEKMVPVGPGELLRNQILVMHPATFPIWATGLAWLLASGRVRGARALGVVFLVVLAILLVNGTSRASYLALAQPPLLAGGGIAIEALGRRSRGWRWLPGAALVALVATGIPALPLALPLLPIDALLEYQSWIALEPPKEEKRAEGPLPGYLADMVGWPGIVDTVARVYHSLPEAERGDAAILTEHYADAGAIDLLGPALGLPKAIGTHNNYWLWGPGERRGDPLLVIGRRDAWLRDAYEQVSVAAHLECGYCLPGRNGTPVYLARGARRSLAELWPALKHYD